MRKMAVKNENEKVLSAPEEASVFCDLFSSVQVCCYEDLAVPGRNKIIGDIKLEHHENRRVGECNIFQKATKLKIEQMRMKVDVLRQLEERERCLKLL